MRYLTLRVWRITALSAFLAFTFSTIATAQTPITVKVDAAFYGDNTEFYAPFRVGETILGAWQRGYADIEASDRAIFRVGGYFLEKDGTENRFELARPVLALMMGTKHHRFTLGTLETDQGRTGIGPDVTTPHGLLPPLAVETLWLTRAYEVGIQWREDATHIVQDLWFNYQKVITEEHREKFDVGFTGRLQTSPVSPLAFIYQFHVVHHGGQQFATGAVSDSFGYGPGVLVRGPAPFDGKSSLEVYGLGSYDRPDRALPELTVKGKAIFVRAAGEAHDWRLHGIAWWGDEFKHEDGDPNYLSRNPDGSTYLPTRNYQEIGLSKVFHAGRTVDLEMSGRANIVQGKVGYSYRLLGILHADVWRRPLP